MKMGDIQGVARERGIAPGRMTKIELIRTLQQAEGNETCFQTGQAQSCGQGCCLWREVCA